MTILLLTFLSFLSSNLSPLSFPYNNHPLITILCSNSYHILTLFSDFLPSGQSFFPLIAVSSAMLLLFHYIFLSGYPYLPLSFLSSKHNSHTLISILLSSLNLLSHLSSILALRSTLHPPLMTILLSTFSSFHHLKFIRLYYLSLFKSSSI